MKRKKLNRGISSSKLKTQLSTTNESSSSAALGWNTSEQEQFQPEPVNPLINPVVLSVLFEVCSGDRNELKNYRLVCKMWHKESLPRWRKSMKLRVDEYDYNQKFQPNMLKTRSRKDSYRKLSMDDITKAAGEREKTGEYEFRVDHFRTFSLRLSRMTIEECMGISGLSFWDSCAPWMHELCLFGDADKNYFPQLKIFLVEKLPNLRSLKLEIDHRRRGRTFLFGRWDFEDGNDNEPEEPEQLSTQEVKEHSNLKALEISYFSIMSFPTSWVEFFRYFPNLQTISLHFQQRRRDPLKYARVEKLLEAIHEIRRRNKNKLCIKHFKLNDRGWDLESDGQISNGVISLFLKLKLPLETLKLDMESTTPVDPVSQIICCHSTTLKTLSLFRGQSETAFTDFPFGAPLDNLTRLKLCGVITPNLSFLRYTPNLQDLYMSVDTGVTEFSDSGSRIFGFLEGKYDFISETRKYCDMSSVSLLRLYKLELNFPIEDTSNMKSLTSWMPNVEVFEGEANAGCFSVMCKEWNNSLRELRLKMGDGIDDEVITGISLKSKKLSRKSSLEVSKLPGNITNLKNLQVCEMLQPDLTFNDNLCAHLLLNITDISIRQGFMKLAYLRKLKLSMSEELKKNLKTELEEKLVKVDIKVSDSCPCRHYEPRLTRTRRPMSDRTGYWDWGEV